MKDWSQKNNVLIVGLGLLGGSYAMGLKRAGHAVRAIDPRIEGLAYAKASGIIDEGYPAPDRATLAWADVIVLALYPDVLLQWLSENAAHIRRDTWITDVTGVKSALLERGQALLPSGVEWIAAHPMAGREVSGVENSDDEIFKQANYIVTPTDKNSPTAIARCTELGRILGFANVTVLSPREHDEIVAYVSQLTHCIAVALMTCRETDHLTLYTGDSFRDLTRIARINDAMWAQLFIANKPALLEQMDRFLEEFQCLRALLCREDTEGLREKMRLSTERRGRFDRKP